MCCVSRPSDWLGNEGVPPFGGPPSKIWTWPQRAVASGENLKSGGGTSKAIHAMMSSSLTQVLWLFSTSSCPRRPHHHLSHCSYISIPYFSTQHFRSFLFISSHFFQLIFYIPGQMAKYLSGQSESWSSLSCDRPWDCLLRSFPLPRPLQIPVFQRFVAFAILHTSLQNETSPTIISSNIAYRRERWGAGAEYHFQEI